MSKTWKDEEERSNPFTLRLICWIALNVSRSIARLTLYPITIYFLVTSPRLREYSKNYLKRIPGKKGNIFQVAKHVFYFASTILDRVYFLTNKHHYFDIKMSGKKIIDEAMDDKVGCVLLGAHVGSFEALRCLAISKEDLPLKVMMYRDHNAMITKILDELNPKISSSVINLADENALFQMKESLDSGSFIGMLGDRVTEDEKQVKCMLLGGEVAMPAGPVTLASILGVPVIVFFGIYLGGNKYYIHIEKLADKLDSSRKNRHEVVKNCMQEYSDCIDTMLKKHPYNWFNYYDYWNDKK